MNLIYSTGTHDFAEIRKRGYFYVDKTAHIYRMIRSSSSVFLSRPRRFGKSLLISTLRAIFSGRRELFTDLWIDSSGYSWETFPIISLDFSRLKTDSLEKLIHSFENQLQEIADYYALDEVRQGDPAMTFNKLVKAFPRDTKVVLLVDEYDKPLLDAIGKPELIEQYRELFKSFFSYAKSLGEHFSFSFFTGVTKFAQVSLFSGMNNPKDISFFPDYATLLGITDDEIDRFFASRVQQIADHRKTNFKQLRQEMKTWYNGYRFSRDPTVVSVYNPFSLFNFLEAATFDNYWFSTGTPTFAYQLIEENKYPVVNFESKIIVGDRLGRVQNIEMIDLPSLLYQSGYLTIQEYDERLEEYVLHFPNREVEKSFFEDLFIYYSKAETAATDRALHDFKKWILTNDFERFFKAFNQFLNIIPYRIHVPKEAYYHSIIYILIKILGFNADAEVMMGTGRIDLLLRTEQLITLIEFKINESPDAALTQIKQQKYYDPYLLERGKVQIIGVNFDTESRSISAWKSEILKSNLPPITK